MEAEEENLSEEKKLSLGQEVRSLYNLQNCRFQGVRFFFLYIFFSFQGVRFFLVIFYSFKKKIDFQSFRNLNVSILRSMLFSQVYSLQLVVDMRTGEVRSLRQQLAVANQQVDNYNHDKEGDLLLLTKSSKKSESEKVKVPLQVS